ncbi:hypothetical protein D3C86_1262880 [compost metagenome]
MQVGFDQARHDQLAVQVEGLPIAGVLAEGCDEIAVLDQQFAMTVSITHPGIDDFQGAHATAPSPR